MFHVLGKTVYHRIQEKGLPPGQSGGPGYPGHGGGSAELNATWEGAFLFLPGSGPPGSSKPL